MFIDTHESKNAIVSKDAIFYHLWYNVIRWSSHIYKKSSLFSFHGFLFLMNNTGEVVELNLTMCDQFNEMKKCHWMASWLTGIYRHLLSRYFKNAVLECLERSQCKFFFWHQPETCFWLCYRSLFFIMLSNLRFVKWVRFLEQNCIVKWVTLSASFCWLWHFGFANMMFFIIWLPVQISFFGTVLGHFSHFSVILRFFVFAQPWWLTSLISPPRPTIKSSLRSLSWISVQLFFFIKLRGILNGLCRDHFHCLYGAFYNF